MIDTQSSSSFRLFVLTIKFIPTLTALITQKTVYNLASIKELKEGKKLNETAVVCAKCLMFELLSLWCKPTHRLTTCKLRLRFKLVELKIINPGVSLCSFPKTCSCLHSHVWFVSEHVNLWKLNEGWKNSYDSNLRKTSKLICFTCAFMRIQLTRVEIMKHQQKEELPLALKEKPFNESGVIGGIKHNNTLPSFMA